MFVWEQGAYEAVSALFKTGQSDYEIARLTGVPRSTVQKWRHKPRSDRRAATSLATWSVEDPVAYSYVLGLYLGDGHIVVRNGRPRFMRVYLDAKYEQLNQEAAVAIAQVFAPAAVHRYDWGDANRTILQVSHKALLVAFPQYGPGKKHDREIELTEWQRELTHAHPAALVRGLSTPTAAAPSTGSRRSCRAAASPSTRIRARAQALAVRSS